MTDKKKLNKELILKYPNLSGNKIYQKSNAKGIGIRKTEFYDLLRKVRKLPEPSIQKRIKSIPKKYKTKPRKIAIPDIPFEQTRFGRIVKDIQKKRNISEQKAIEHTRFLLKVSKRDYILLNKKDVMVLSHYGY